MGIPQSLTHDEWVSLNSDDKRRRTLEIADAMFARDGLEVTMPALAAAIGIGVGSLYRQFATKDELITELMLERIDAYYELWGAAVAADDAWAGVREAVFATVEMAADDHISREMLAAGEENEIFTSARKRISTLVKKATQRAIDQGALRDDASDEDVRRIVRAVHAASSTSTADGRRLAVLALDGLERR